MSRNFVILVIYMLKIIHAEPIDLTQQSDAIPHYRRRGLESTYQSLDSLYFQPPTSPPFTSEVEAAILAHSAAYQATRARDLAQIRSNVPVNTGTTSPIAYQNVAVERKAFQTLPGDLGGAYGKQHYFPEAVHVQPYTPTYYSRQDIITHSTTTPRPNNFPQDLLTNQALILPPPKVHYYEKMRPVGKLQYRTLDVNVETPYNTMTQGIPPKIDYYQKQNKPFLTTQNRVSFQKIEMPNDYLNVDSSRSNDNHLVKLAISRALKALQRKYIN